MFNCASLQENILHKKTLLREEHKSNLSSYVFNCFIDVLEYGQTNGNVNEIEKPHEIVALQREAVPSRHWTRQWTDEATGDFGQKWTSQWIVL
jgi:hypothetical protein